MRLLLRFRRFGAKGAGLLSRIRRVIDEHSRVLENIDAEGGVSVRKNSRGGLTFSGKRGSGGGVLGPSLYASKNLEDITVSPGHWVHRYSTPVAIDETVFWFGDPADIPAGAIQLINWINYGYAEYANGEVTFDVTGTYPLSASSYLRRCLFSFDTTDGSFQVKNAGDIVTW